jgi:CHAD domain-containing protein
MSFILDARHPVPVEIGRLMQEEIATALTNLQSADNRAQGIHEARKSMKKLRGVLRLVRGNLKRKVYIRENARYRDTARLLAKARDTYVIYETLDTLRPYLEDRKVLNALRRHYSKVYRQAQADVLDDESLLAEVVERLEQGTKRAEKLNVPDTGWKAIEENLMLVYTRGRKAYRVAKKKGMPEDFHEWRKRAKYLWYHVRLLSPAWEGMLGAWAHELKQLSDLLGLAHDLVVMDEALAEFSEQHDIEPLLVASAQERQRLESEALQLGARLYAEAPADFVARVGSYWRVWMRQIASTDEE